MTLLKDRIGQLYPETWQARRQNLIHHTNKIYEDNILNNPFLTSHDLLGFIDRKLSNPKNKGEVFIDMSKSILDNMNAQDDAVGKSESAKNSYNPACAPYDIEQIESLNKIDQASFLRKNLEQSISKNDFKDEKEKLIASQNLKCLNLYEF